MNRQSSCSGRLLRAAGVTALLTIAGAQSAAACDLCAIYTGSLMQSEKTGFHAGVAEQYTSFGSVREDDHSVPNEADEWVHSSITQLIAGYTFSPWIVVQANVPLISREYRRLEEGVRTRGDVGGLGDMTLMVRSSPLSRAFSDVLVHTEVLAGLKLPTGSGHLLGEELDEGSDGDDHEEEEDGDDAPSGLARVPRHGDDHEASAVHGHDLALGSGSVDGVFGASLHTSWQRVFGDLSVQYVVRGNGDFSYEYANDLTWEAASGYYVLARDTWTASASVVTSGENKGRDHQKSTLSGDTALTAVYLGPGLAMTWRDALHAALAVDLPLVQDTTGRQIVADYRLRAGLLWRF